MWTDPIVEEIHQIRAEHAAQFNYDLAAIVEDLRKQEQKSGKRFVSFPPRRLVVDEEIESKAMRTNQKVVELSSVLAEAV